MFCQIGSTTDRTLERKEWVPTGDVLEEFDRWAAEGHVADFITLSGSGEPTLHSDFGKVLEHVKAFDRFKTALLSNGSLMWLPEVRRDAALADVVKVTVSAWDEESFQRIHRPAEGLTFERLLAGQRDLRAEYGGTLWVEVMILPGYNDMPEQIRAMADLVASLRADAVHLNTVTRPAQAGVALARAPEPLLRTVAPWFSPQAELPTFQGRTGRPESMSDSTWLDLLARHPIAVEALAESAGVDVAAIEQRLHPLVLAGRVVMESHEGVRMARVGVS